MPGSLLIVDDNEEGLASLRAGFARYDYEVLATSSGEEAMEILNLRDIDVVVTDLKMPGAGGMEVLQASQERKPSPQVIIITAFGSVESAVDALHQGAFTYLTKPVNLGELRHQVEKAMELQTLRRENVVLRREIGGRFGFEDMVGETREIADVIERTRAVADTKATVLIEGESGTGKELVARAIHRHSPRAAKPFIPVNCAALSESLIESELFGHEKGSFTGASARRQGVFELADGGTIFLDEVGEIPLATQVKLLRVLETREFMRVGGTAPVRVDVRVITATNRVLADEVEEGRFREDLFYRLNVVKITLPPLRARATDIPLLVDRFLHEFAQEHKKTTPVLTRKATNRLMQFPWPGNIRQLRNIVENLVVFARGGEIDVEDLPKEVAEHQTEEISIAVGMPLDQVERKMIERTLLSTGGNRTKAAEALGISRRTLLRRLKELSIEA